MSTPPSTVSKRPTEERPNLEGEPRPTKMQRFEPLVASLKMVLISDNSLGERNLAWLNENTFKQLFQTEETPQFISVANRIYQVAIIKGLNDNEIGINGYQKTDISPLPTESNIIVSAVDKVRLDSIPSVGTITFELLPENDPGKQSIEHTVLELSDLQYKFLTNLDGQVFSEGQQLFTFAGLKNIKVVVKQIRGADKQLQQGRLTTNSKIDFSFNPLNGIVVIDKIHRDNVTQYNYKLVLKKSQPAPKASDLPLKVHEDFLKSQIADFMRDSVFFKGHIIEIQHTSGWIIQIIFENGKVDDQNSFSHENAYLPASKYQGGYALKEEPKICFNISSTEKLLITSGQVEPATQIEFQFVRILGRTPGSDIQIDQEQWIDLTEFRQAIRNLQRAFVLRDHFEVELSSGRFEIKVGEIRDRGFHPVLFQDNFVQEWQVNEETSIVLKCEKSKKINLIPDPHPVEIKSVQFTVRNIDMIRDEDFYLTKDELKELCLNYLPARLCKRQSFTVLAKGAVRLAFTVNKIEFANHEPIEKGQTLFGKAVKDQTEIEFIGASGAVFKIVDKVYEGDEIDYLNFQLEVVRSKVRNKWEKLPITVNADQLILDLREKLRQKPFIFEEGLTILRDHGGWDIHLVLEKGHLVDKDLAFERDNHRSLNQHKEGFSISEETRIELDTVECTDILFTKGTPETAHLMAFKIVSQIENYSSKKHPENLGNWISENKLKSKLLSSKKPLVKDTSFTVDLETGKFQIQLVRARPLDGIEVSDKPYQPTWEITENTSVFIAEDSDLGISVVDDRKVFDLKKVVIEVKTALTERELMFILFGLIKPPEGVVIDEREIRSLFNEVKTENLFKRQSFITNTNRGRKIQMKVSETEFVEDVRTGSQTRVVGRITEQTECVIHEAKENAYLVIQGEMKFLEIRDPSEYLSHIKLGGLGNQFKELRRIFYMHYPEMRKEAKRLGLEPVKGALFYGPPGTGKTSIAREIGRMLGAEKEPRFKKIIATSLLNKYVGGSEAKVDELFKDAEEAYEKYGDDSPVFIIVIDELDGVGRSRGGFNGEHGDKLLTHLLGRIDGLDKINNVLVIGSTNRLDSLDSALIRPGRFELHIEVGLPDSKGRKQIFDIYLKKLREEGLLEKEVDIDYLVNRTEQFTGADIKAVITKAMQYRQERYFEQVILTTSGKKEEHPKILVTKEDINQGLEDMVKQKQGSRSGLSMYT